MKTAQCQNYKISVRILESQEGSFEFHLSFIQVRVKFGPFIFRFQGRLLSSPSLLVALTVYFDPRLWTRKFNVFVCRMSI